MPRLTKCYVLDTLAAVASFLSANDHLQGASDLRDCVREIAAGLPALLDDDGSTDVTELEVDDGRPPYLPAR